MIHFCFLLLLVMFVNSLEHPSSCSFLKVSTWAVTSTKEQLVRNRFLFSPWPHCNILNCDVIHCSRFMFFVSKILLFWLAFEDQNGVQHTECDTTCVISFVRSIWNYKINTFLFKTKKVHVINELNLIREVQMGGNQVKRDNKSFWGWGDGPNNWLGISITLHKVYHGACLNILFI